jgi:uncharacterized membrane protein YbhN (UPF0104 family)
LGIGAQVGILKMKQISISRSFAGIGSEIFYDITFAILISSVGLLIYGRMIIKDFLKMINLNFFILPIILGIVILAIIYFLRKNKFIENFVKNILRSFSSKNLIKNSLITLGLYTASVAMAYFLYKSVGLSINPLLLLFAARLGYLLGLLSFIPGGLGVRDSVFGYICSLSGIPLHIALSISVIARFICLIVVIAMLLIVNIFKREQNIGTRYVKS